MKQILRKTYLFTGYSLLAAFLAAYIFTSMHIVQDNRGSSWCIGYIMMLVGFFGANNIQASIHAKKLDETGSQYIENSTFRLGFYWMGILGLGLGLATSFADQQSKTPFYLPAMLGITTLIFCGASLFAYSMTTDEILKYGNQFKLALFLLFAIQSAIILRQAYLYSIQLTNIFYKGSGYIFYGIFSSSIILNAYEAINMKNPDHLGMAASFFLDCEIPFYFIYRQKYRQKIEFTEKSQ